MTGLDELDRAFLAGGLTAIALLSICIVLWVGVRGTWRLAAARTDHQRRIETPPDTGRRA